jgi:hypothetical protein
VFWQQTLRVERLVVPSRYRVLIRTRRSLFRRNRRAAAVAREAARATPRPVICAAE